MRKYKMFLEGGALFFLLAAALAAEQNVTKIITCSLPGEGDKEASFFIDNITKFRDAHPDLYASYAKSCGWTVEGTGSSAVIYYSDSLLTQGNKITSKELKELLRQGCIENTYNQKIHNKPLAALVKVLTLPEYLDIQVLDFIERLHSAENKVVLSAGNKRFY
ncbi:TPA: hypothetical protein MH668_21850 [Klebsiella pneumoniae]|nr:hypothetical protein [Klebsiella pneumoniae]